MELQPAYMPERNEDTGQYTGEFPEGDFLDAIEAEGGMAGTGEIADRVGCAHDTAYKRLQKLEERDMVSSRLIGNTLLWEVATEE